MTYTQVAAGSCHTVLLRCDGTAVACGSNSVGQCNIPALDGVLTFGLPTLVLQASLVGTSLHFATMGGKELCQLEAAAARSLKEIHAQLMHEMRSTCPRVDVLLPGGELLSKTLSQDPLAVLGSPSESSSGPSTC